MLNAFDDGGIKQRPADSLPCTEATIGRLPTRDNIAHRLVVRKWLIALAFALFFGFAAAYSIPWEAGISAGIVFAVGAALIPRSGLSVLAEPLILSPQTGANNPDTAAIAQIFVEALPEPVLLLAADGTVLFYNKRAHDAFDGLKTGWHISGVIRNPQVLDAVANAGKAAKMRTVNYVERVPVEKHLAATVSWLDGASGRGGSAILVLVRDLTEQERMDQMRADFIANASHELKTPLASLLGFIETLQGAAKHDGEARERFLAIMARQAERMARLIDNLMSLSRVEMRAHLRPQDQVRIADVVRAACDALEPMAAEANVRLNVSSTVNGACVQADRDELTQVFVNLVQNAIKYGRPGGAVSIALGRLPKTSPATASRISVTVEDDGLGIAAQHLPRLTERFYRVPDGGAPERGGTGLGLAIVKHVINRHRGELQISSQEGVGSKFTVLLAEIICEV